MIPERLDTGRVLLRPVVPDDAPAIVEALRDWDVVKWLAVVPWPYTAEDAAGFVAAAGPGGPFWQTWVLARSDEPARLLGVLSLAEELGYWLARESWGQRLMPEAARAVLAAHFAEPDAPDVLSGWFDGNERSERILTSLGFVEDGMRRSHCFARGEDVPSHRMRLTRAAFRPA